MTKFDWHEVRLHSERKDGARWGDCGESLGVHMIRTLVEMGGFEGGEQRILVPGRLTNIFFQITHISKISLLWKGIRGSIETAPSRCFESSLHYARSTRLDFFLSFAYSQW